MTIPDIEESWCCSPWQQPLFDPSVEPFLGFTALPRLYNQLKTHCLKELPANTFCCLSPALFHPLINIFWLLLILPCCSSIKLGYKPADFGRNHDSSPLPFWSLEQKRKQPNNLKSAPLQSISALIPNVESGPLETHTQHTTPYYVCETNVARKMEKLQ